MVRKAPELRTCWHFFWEHLWEEKQEIRPVGRKARHLLSLPVDQGSEFNLTCVSEFSPVWAVEVARDQFCFHCWISGWSTGYQTPGEDWLKDSLGKIGFLILRPADAGEALLTTYKVCACLVGALTAPLFWERKKTHNLLSVWVLEKLFKAEGKKSVVLKQNFRLIGDNRCISL